MTSILIHPGLYNSGPGHWQTIWEETMPDTSRVQQANWDEPNRDDWVATLDTWIRQVQTPLVLVAHSLGCATIAWWAARHGHEPHAARIKGALLVAPPDVEQTDFPHFVKGFAPMPRHLLPFNSIVVSSSNDPWCISISRARSWAADWGATFHNIGAHGHINGDSGLGDWEQGRKWLAKLSE